MKTPQDLSMIYNDNSSFYSVIIIPCNYINNEISSQVKNLLD